MYPGLKVILRIGSLPVGRETAPAAGYPFRHFPDLLNEYPELIDKKLYTFNTKTGLYEPKEKDLCKKKTFKEAYDKFIKMKKNNKLGTRFKIPLYPMEVLVKKDSSAREERLDPPVTFKVKRFGILFNPPCLKFHEKKKYQSTTLGPVFSGKEDAQSYFLQRDNEYNVGKHKSWRMIGNCASYVHASSWGIIGCIGVLQYEMFEALLKGLFQRGKGFNNTPLFEKEEKEYKKLNWKHKARPHLELRIEKADPKKPRPCGTPASDDIYWNKCSTPRALANYKKPITGTCIKP